MELKRQLKRTKPTMKGEDVRQAQVKLSELYLYTGKIDGLYGPLTEKAARAYQKMMGLKVDGIIGPITWGSLFPAAINTPGPAGGLTGYAASQVGGCYVSGGQGQQGTPALIRKLEKDDSNYKRALATYNKHLAAGQSITIYDCSGLIINYLLNIVKTTPKDLTANGIFYTLCDPIERAEVQAGDLVCKKYATNSKVYHIGVYMGDGTVVHAKGRDYGVVRESINAAGWNRYGRLKAGLLK